MERSDIVTPVIEAFSIIDQNNENTDKSEFFQAKKLLQSKGHCQKNKTATHTLGKNLYQLYIR